MKRCGNCKALKEEGSFPRDRKSKDGRGSRCKACDAAYYQAHKERKKATSRAYHNANRDRARVRLLKYKYGLSEEAFRVLRDTQEDLCACCSLQKPLVVDHDHRTGRVRGLLCQDCNTVLGRAHDSPDICERAAAYLRKHS